MRRQPRRRAGDCSITVPFWQAGYAGKGSFALVVMLDTGNIGIVGQPLPVRAVLRVDGNPALGTLDAAPFHATGQLCRSNCDRLLPM